MSTYLIIKWIHIVSSVVLVGTGFGTAYFFFFANRSGNVQAIAAVARLVVRADWWFTTPAAVVQTQETFRCHETSESVSGANSVYNSQSACQIMGMP